MAVEREIEKEECTRRADGEKHRTARVAAISGEIGGEDRGKRKAEGIAARQPGDQCAEEETGVQPPVPPCGAVHGGNRHHEGKQHQVFGPGEGADPEREGIDDECRGEKRRDAQPSDEEIDRDPERGVDEFRDRDGRDEAEPGARQREKRGIAEGEDRVIGVIERRIARRP
jgi:hypothetical protein